MTKGAVDNLTLQDKANYAVTRVARMYSTRPEIILYGEERANRYGMTTYWYYFSLMVESAESRAQAAWMSGKITI